MKKNTNYHPLRLRFSWSEAGPEDIFYKFLHLALMTVRVENPHTDPASRKALPDWTGWVRVGRGSWDAPLLKVFSRAWDLLTRSDTSLEKWLSHGGKQRAWRSSRFSWLLFSEKSKRNRQHKVSSCFGGGVVLFYILS